MEGGGGRRGSSVLTVHLCGFSPVCLRMCTTSMYWALKGFACLLHSFHSHTKLFLLAWMWSLAMCCKISQIKFRGGDTLISHVTGRA